MSLQRIVPIDYKNTTNSIAGSIFLFDCAKRLKLKPCTSAAAALLYHRFYAQLTPERAKLYDDYTFAAAALFLGSKVKEERVALLDLVNVAHYLFERQPPSMERYAKLRDGVLAAELLIARSLGFDFDLVAPHKFLLYYLKSLKDLFTTETWSALPVAKAALSFLQDLHHNRKVIYYEPTHMAIASISLALQTYGMLVPVEKEGCSWYKPLAHDLTGDEHSQIIDAILEVYKTDVDKS